MSTRIAGIDLGLKGAAVLLTLDDRDLLHFVDVKVWDLSKIKDSADRYFTFQQIVGPICSKVDVVAYEQVQFHRGKSTIPGMEAILLSTSRLYNRMVYGINVSTLKAFAGHGGADKKMMSQKIALEWPTIASELLNRLTEHKDVDNPIDAAWAAIWAAEHMEVG